jgi:hypothetical protein
MIMINTNFTKQDNQNPPVSDQSEKDAKADDFTALMAGLCMTPQTGTPVKDIPVSEKPLEQSDAEFPASAAQAEPGATASIKNSALAQLLQPAQPDLKTAQAAAGTLDGTIKMAPQLVIPVKPVIKDLKTQVNKFEEVPAETAQINGIKNFAAMAKEKAGLVQSQINGAHAHLDPGVMVSDSEISDQDVTHFDHNYVVDPVRLADFISDRAQRKLPKLISDVTEMAAEENTTAVRGELALQSETSVLPKVTAMLEQIKPALIQLAAATANDGKQILKMRLHPAELGTVEIRLEKNDAGVLEAHFRTDNDAAKHFLTQGLDQLRISLQNAGWNIGKVEVTSSAFSSPNGDDGSAQKDAAPGRERSRGSNMKNFITDPTRSNDNANSSADHLVSLRA